MNQSLFQKAIVICSGGMDSITTLYWAKQKYKEVDVLTFDYGSKHNKREQEFAKYHCKKLGVKHKIIKLDFNSYGFKSNLLKNDSKIPEGHYSADNMSATVVPYRNGIMLSIAVGYAESVGAKAVLLGSHRGDRAQYPDCTVEFTKAQSLASQLGTSTKVKIVSPFNNWMKWDILKLGLKLGIDFSNTWSCYVGKKRPCGRCGTCVERCESFYRNKTTDPLMTEKEWVEAVSFMKSVVIEIK